MMRSQLHNLQRTGRSIALRPKILYSSYPIPLYLRLHQRRTITADEKPLPEAEDNPGPNQEQLPHVSEEAATIGQITGEGGPEVEQGTPVQEVSRLMDFTCIASANSVDKRC